MISWIYKMVKIKDGGISGKRNNCVDCGINIWNRSKRCGGCAIKNRDNSKMSKNFGDTCGEKNGRWAGDKVGYFALHSWVRKNKPKPRFCEDCGENEPKDVANVSGEYKRDIEDYRWLCRGCHYKKDRLNNSDKRDNLGRFVKQNE